MRLFAFAGLLAGLLAIHLPAQAEDAADIAAGRDLAKMWCAECHITGAGQPKAVNDAIPSFAAVANSPGVTEMALRAFLATPHPVMPNIALTRPQTDQIVAYILSLRTR